MVVRHTRLVCSRVLRGWWYDIAKWVDSVLHTRDREATAEALGGEHGAGADLAGRAGEGGGVRGAGGAGAAHRAVQPLHAQRLLRHLQQQGIQNYNNR